MKSTLEPASKSVRHDAPHRHLCRQHERQASKLDVVGNSPFSCCVIICACAKQRALQAVSGSLTFSRPLLLHQSFSATVATLASHDTDHLLAGAGQLCRRQHPACAENGCCTVAPSSAAGNNQGRSGVHALCPYVSSSELRGRPRVWACSCDASGTAARPERVTLRGSVVRVSH